MSLSSATFNNNAYSVCGLILPVELINEIVGYAALVDLDTLLNVCVVCKWWADVSFRVARRVIVISAFVVRSDEDEIHEESRTYRRRLEELALFRYLPQYVREVNFCRPSIQRRVSISVRGLPMFHDHLHHCHVRRTLELLPRVDVLRLESIEWADCPVENPWHGFCKRAFESIVFSDVKICGDENHPMSILRAAQTVGHLIMGYERGSVQTLEDVSSTALSRITLQHIGAVPDHRFYILFLARRNSIVRLDAGSVAVHNIPHMQVLLRAHIFSLQHLGLSFHSPGISACITCV